MNLWRKWWFLGLGRKETQLCYYCWSFPKIAEVNNKGLLLSWIVMLQWLKPQWKSRNGHGFFLAYWNWPPSKVWPKFQCGGATFVEVAILPSLVVTRNEMPWPTRTLLVCQFMPQFRVIGCQFVLVPLNSTAVTSPLPPTLCIRTRLKYLLPLSVNLIPPFLIQGTLVGRVHNLELAMLPDT